MATCVACHGGVRSGQLEATGGVPSGQPDLVLSQCVLCVAIGGTPWATLVAFGHLHGLLGDVCRWSQGG
eukprot:1365698-Heterocapsa_arctica.AAC.1